MNDKEYHEIEAKRYFRKINDIQNAPLADRKEARQELLSCCQESPEIITERLEWLFHGTYGYYEQFALKQILADCSKSRRINKNARLFNLLALNEFFSPDANWAWKKLTKEQQEKLTEAINAADFTEQE